VHRPGDPARAEPLLESLLSMLRAAGLEAELGLVEDLASRRGGGEKLLLLMPSRGGHWASLVEAGYRVEMLPVHVWASALAEEALHRGAVGVQVVALEARRLRELQRADLERARRVLSLYGLEARLVMLPSLSARPPRLPGRRWLQAPAAMLPGRLEASACAAAPGRCLGPIMGYAAPRIAAWIVEAAEGEEPGREASGAT